MTQITTINFGPTKSRQLVIPFKRKELSKPVVDPPWLIRLNQVDSLEELSYHHLSQIYVYLRSIRTFIARSGFSKQWKSWRKIDAKIGYLFSRDGFCNNLDVKEVVHSLIRRGVGPGTSHSFRKEFFKIPDNMDEENERDAKLTKMAKEYMEDSAKGCRAAQWKWRLQVAVKDAIDNGWYPMFGTYTVDPKILPIGIKDPDALWKETPAWDRFVKRFRTEVAEACGYGRKPAKWPPVSSFMQYFGVLEHGKSRKHPHVHVVWLCKEIPDTWKIDPNRNCSLNLNRDIKPASALWPHGIQRKTCGIFINDSWFADNWKVPIDEKTLKPIKVGDASAIAGYVSKYLSKGESKEWNHRVKATKNLGLQKLMKKVSKIVSLGLLLVMSSRPQDYSKCIEIQNQTSIPMPLLRKISKQELMQRLHSMKTLRAKEYLRDQWTKNQNKFFTSFLKKVKNGHRPWSMTPEQRYNFITPMLEAPSDTVHSDKRMEWLLNWLVENETLEINAVNFTRLKEKILL